VTHVPISEAGAGCMSFAFDLHSDSSSIFRLVFAFVCSQVAEAAKGLAVEHEAAAARGDAPTSNGERCDFAQTVWAPQTW
jgi:hypothetical protein